MICAAHESGAKRTDKGTAGESRCRKAMGLNGASRTTAGLPKTENSPSSGPQGQEGGFFMREKKFGKRFLAWVLTMVLTVSLLPLSAMAADGEELDENAALHSAKVMSKDAHDNALTSEVVVQGGTGGRWH